MSSGTSGLTCRYCGKNWTTCKCGEPTGSAASDLVLRAAEAAYAEGEQVATRRIVAIIEAYDCPCWQDGCCRSGIQRDLLAAIREGNA